MKRFNIMAILSLLAAVCFIVVFIRQRDALYLILGIIWVIIGIGRLIRPASGK